MRIFIVLFLVFLSTVAGAQNIRSGVILGMNASQVNGDKLGGFNKFGLNAGFMAIVPMRKNFSFNMEIIYSQKGSKAAIIPRTSPNLFKLKLDYIDVPLEVKYTDKGIFSFGTGVAIGTLVKVQQFDSRGIEVTPGPYHKFDLNYIATVDYEFTPHFHLNLRYAYSIIPMIRVMTSTTKFRQHNYLLSFRLIYTFKGAKLEQRTKPGLIKLR